MTIDKDQLKALAEAAIRSCEDSGQRWPQDDDWFAPDDDGEELEFVKAANPATILALLDEIDGLNAQHGRDSAELRRLCSMRDLARKQRDQLKAENEALRKDAERYRWLRDPDNQCAVEDDSDYYMPPMVCGYVEHEDILTHEALDTAIDAAMAKEADQ